MSASKPSFFAELKRRNVHRAAVFYAASAWLLVQIATQVFPFYDVPNWMVRWVIAALVIGFPFAMTVSWFYEFTPKGFKRERETVPAVAISAPSVSVVESAPTATAEASVAILPFADFSAAMDQDYFCDGLSEDLITALSQFAGLKVISRDSSFQFRDRKDGSATIGQKLGVANLLEGSVRRAGDVVRISATLVKAADGSTLWSQHYDRAYKDLFALQDDITQAVASALQARLLPTTSAAIQNTRPPSGNLDAYNAWLQGNFYSARSTEDDIRRAIGDYDRAIALDPLYAQAYASRSLALTDLGSSYLSGETATDTYIHARSNARRALSLAPDLLDAHLVLGQLLVVADFDLESAEIAYRKAGTLAPDAAGPKLHLGGILGQLGHLEEGAEQLRQALQLDPLSSRTHRALADIELAMGRLDAAEQSIRKAIALQPDAATNYRTLVYIDVCRGDMAAALRDAQQEPAVQYRVVEVMMALHVGGDRGKADAVLAQLIAEYGDYVSFQIAGAYALRKDPDQAFAWLDRGWAARDPGICKLLLDPFLLAYKDDPRFAAFCRKVGLPAPGAAVPSATGSTASPASTSAATVGKP